MPGNYTQENKQNFPYLLNDAVNNTYCIASSLSPQRQFNISIQIDGCLLRRSHCN